jgi:hypothetical protein
LPKSYAPSAVSVAPPQPPLSATLPALDMAAEAFSALAGFVSANLPSLAVSAVAHSPQQFCKTVTCLVDLFFSFPFELLIN